MARLEILLMRGLGLALLALALTGLPGLLRPEGRRWSLLSRRLNPLLAGMFGCVAVL